MTLRTGFPNRMPGAGGFVVIDLAAIARNYLRLCDLAPSATVGAVVKADAYGLGAEQVCDVLQAAGCRLFFVAHLFEALNIAPRLTSGARLIILNGLQPGTEVLCADHAIVPVLNSLEQASRWVNLAETRGERLPAVLQVDSGMSRLGLSLEDLSALSAGGSLAALDLQFLMSHLACADVPDHPLNAIQLEVLGTASGLFPALPVSLANSGGVFLGPAYGGAIARPGIALYGGAPTSNRDNPMDAVVSLHVDVIQTRSVRAGTFVGYGGASITERDMRLATLSAGYADGLPRSLSPMGAAWFGDTRLPIVGRVSMDSITVDISALPEGAVGPGSRIELIGPHQSLDTIASDAGTISYEILTRLGRRFHREYRWPAKIEPLRQA